MVGKTEVCTGLVFLGDVFNPVFMENCPTRSEFAVLVIRPENQDVTDSHQANEKLYAIIALCQGNATEWPFQARPKVRTIPTGYCWSL